MAYGTPSRIARAAIGQLEREGIRAGLLRPITLWPCPGKALKQVAMQKSVHAVVDVVNHLAHAELHVHHGLHALLHGHLL